MSRPCPKFISRRNINRESFRAPDAEVYDTKIPLANFSIRDTLCVRAQVVRFKKESQMAWKAPKIVEVPVGMEINMYACAARK